MNIRVVLAGVSLAVAGVWQSSQRVPRTRDAFLEDDAIVVRLVPAPAERERELRWSPKGAKVELASSTTGGLRGVIALGGPDTAAIMVELRRSRTDGPIDSCVIDHDRNGAFDDADLVLTCFPSERRGKTWSSFQAVLSVPVTDPWNERASVPYPISLWYVHDPAAPDGPAVVRWTRRGFFTGVFAVDGAAALLMLCEGTLDGVLDRRDSWALAPAGSSGEAMTAGASRRVSEHAWLGEQAWRIATVDPSGLLAVLVPHEPGMTRAQEIEQRDRLAADRRAARSGQSVAFMHDFAAAEARARREGKRLLVDFETTWCGPCKQMDQWVYTADVVVVAAADVIAVKVDGDLSRDVMTRFRVRAFPTLILLDPDGTELDRRVGYVGVTDTVAFLDRE